MTEVGSANTKATGCTLALHAAWTLKGCGFLRAWTCLIGKQQQHRSTRPTLPGKQSGPGQSVDLARRDVKRRSLRMPQMIVQSARATAALRQSPLAALRKLSIQETDASVMILGRVPSYYLKQLAQETVMPVLDGRAL